MTLEKYYQKVAALQEKYLKMNIFDNNDYMRQFNVVSAGLLNYLPNIHFEEHETIFKRILLHQRLSVLEQGNLHVLDSCQLEGFTAETLVLLRSKPAIICTFHLGSYRLLNLLLAQHEIPFALVASDHVVQTQGAVFADLHRQLHGSNLSLISAEGPSSAIKMLRELKNGKSLLIYIDGNTGTGKHTIDNQNSCQVSFLNQRIKARRGIGFLAHVAGVPVLPAFCYRRAIDDLRLKFFSFISPEGQQDRDSFATDLVQTIYNMAAPYIKQYPEQWEAWLYLPKVAQLVNPFPGEKRPEANLSKGDVKFDTFRFGLFKTASKNYIFDKSNFLSYPITDHLYSKLSSATKNSTCYDGIDAKTYDELLKNGVLITS